MVESRGEVETLEEYVKSRAITSGFHNAVKEAYEMHEEGKISLVDPRPPDGILAFLLRPDYSLWSYSVAALVALTMASVIFSDSITIFKYLRYVTGSLYVLFLPGYLLIEALYPEERSLSPLERLALSLGLSLAVVPLIGLVLNYTPWGIRFTPIVVSLLVYDIILLSVALARKYHYYRMRWESLG